LDASLSNQALAERVFTSPPTCLRRVKRLRDAGLIERQVAILNPERLAQTLGHGLTPLWKSPGPPGRRTRWTAFENRVAPDDGRAAVLPRVAGAGLCAGGAHPHMPDYHALAQRLFTSDANVRNVKAFFSIKRSKFGAELP
jgi:Lrp/AsnC family leucine-responsive transcriptional regulator